MLFYFLLVTRRDYICSIIQKMGTQTAVQHFHGTELIVTAIWTTTVQHVLMCSKGTEKMGLRTRGNKKGKRKTENEL